MHPKIPADASERPILVIGAAGVDMVGVLNAPVSRGRGNLAYNRFSFGGVARNVAENLARLGHRTILLTAVGKDQLGERLLEHTRACGVDLPECHCQLDLPTASYLAVYNPEGYLELALEDMRALSGLTPAYLKTQKDLFHQAGVVFVDANLDPKALKTVFQLAKNAGVPVCADCTSTAMGPRLIPHMESICLLTANNAEATALFGGNPEVLDQSSALQAARQFVLHGVEIAVISLGKSGVCYSAQDVNGHIPAIQTQVLDPTGAGDALTATVLFGLVNDIPLDEAVRLGVTAASLVLRHSGTVYPELSLERLYDQLD
jgi:pseudouridine kinase